MLGRASFLFVQYSFWLFSFLIYNRHRQFPSLFLPPAFAPSPLFPSHNLFFPTFSSLMSLLSPPHSPLPSLLFAHYYISILPSPLAVSPPISLPPILFFITPTDPSVLFQACISISQCYLHVNSSSQIFIIVPSGETSS